MRQLNGNVRGCEVWDKVKLGNWVWKRWLGLRLHELALDMWVFHVSALRYGSHLRVTLSLHLL